MSRFAKTAKKKFYAVLTGRDGPGMYQDWSSCASVVTGYPSKYKGFVTQDEAFDFMRTGGVMQFPLYAPSQSQGQGSATTCPAQRGRLVILSTGQTASNSTVTVAATMCTKRKLDPTTQTSDTERKQTKLERHGEAKRKAEADILRSINHPSTIVATCDGACKVNPGNCSYGVLVMWPVAPNDKNVSQKSDVVIAEQRKWSAHAKFLGHGTNNIGELRGIVRVLQIVQTWAKTNDATTRRNLHIFSDSDYSVNSVLGIYNGKDNSDLIEQARQLVRQLKQLSFIDVQLQWIPAHVGITCNEMVDKLANEVLQPVYTRDKTHSQITTTTDDIVRSGTGLKL